jgi:hypothetical protein
MGGTDPNGSIMNKEGNHSTVMYLKLVLYGCETWTLTLTKEHRLRVCESRVLRIFGSNEEAREDYIMRNFITFTCKQT